MYLKAEKAHIAVRSFYMIKIIFKVYFFNAPFWMIYFLLQQRLVKECQSHIQAEMTTDRAL